MKNACIALSALALLLASCKENVTVTTTTDTPEPVAVKDTVNDKPLDSAAIQEARKAYATPGEAHRMMADETGTWDVQMKFWEAPETVSESATSVAGATMILGGHYQEVAYKGTIMGMAFEGKSTMAFNNKTGEYTSTWIDNMGTGMMIVKGHYDEATKAINMTGSMTDPTDGKNINIREVYTFVDPNTRKLETFDTKEGKKEFKSMEIVLKRRK